MSLSKRIVFYIVALFFGFCLVVISALSVGKKADAHEGHDHVIADSELGNTASDSAQPDVEDLTQPEQSEYILPYPGLLPDHPLYSIKMLRDRIQMLLVNDPVEKFDLVLLNADKRIGAAQALIIGGKLDIGLDTARKAEGYLTQAQQILSEMEIVDKGETLHRSALKHEEILQSFTNRVVGEQKNKLDTVIEMNALILSDVSSKFPLEEVSNEASTSGEVEIELPEEEYFPVEISM